MLEKGGLPGRLMKADQPLARSFENHQAMPPPSLGRTSDGVRCTEPLHSLFPRGRPHPMPRQAADDTAVQQECVYLNLVQISKLDDCVNDVAHVSAEVIFGESGKDVQSEDFKTKMREVRSSASKGLDSFAIIARCISPPKISSLLVPIRNILQQTETLKVMQQVEDLLRRIAGGLNANQHLTPKDLLVLCHTLISQNAKFLKQVPKAAPANQNTKGDALTELKKNLTAEVDHYANNSFR